ncbi:TPA: hypothetical protein QDA90_003499 [Burkholderia vietnamiensis]|uniref:hypothetical protein n=1 Tax=Burkholderia vietnamiensis TaxID=60552 RepID=UPI00298ABA84|nr:hypothetical protein [Burkholderia vietnamiensis]
MTTTDKSRADALTDAQREELELIERCDPAFLLNHVEERTAFDANLLVKIFELAKVQARVLLAASPVEQHEAAPADAIESKLRVLMGAVNAYEKATGIGGWYAERIQESCNAILKGAGSNVRFGISGENPIAQAEPQAADAREDHECVYANGDGVCRECAALAKAARPEPRAADERAASNDYVEWRLHANGMFGILAEIVGAGALARHGDDDLSDRVELAIANHEQLMSRSAAARAPRTDVAGTVPDMVERSLREIARQCARNTTERHAYLPSDADTERNFEPHAWVLDAMRAAVRLDRTMNRPSEDAAAAPADAHAVEGVRAWETNDGRVISDEQKQRALAEGGATASSVRSYAHTLGRITNAQAVEAVDYDRVVSICDAHGIGLPVDCIELVVEIVRHAASPPPALASAPVGMMDALRQAREELSLVEWENDPPARVIELFSKIDALLVAEPGQRAGGNSANR